MAKEFICPLCDTPSAQYKDYLDCETCFASFWNLGVLGSECPSFKTEASGVFVRYFSSHGGTSIHAEATFDNESCIYENKHFLKKSEIKSFIESEIPLIIQSLLFV
jgi:hypothetical protein